MRVLMLRTVEPRREGELRFEKNTHVDVSDEQGQAWERDEIAIEENVSGHTTPATPVLSDEKRKQLGLPVPASVVGSVFSPVGSASRSAAATEE